MPRHKFQRGNKFGGRKAIPEDVKEIARAATPRALQRQIELMESKDENVALKATNSILDRAFESLHRHSLPTSPVGTCLSTLSPSWSQLPMRVGLVRKQLKVMLRNDRLVRLRRSSSGLFCFGPFDASRS